MRGPIGTHVSEVRVPVRCEVPGPLFLELERIGKAHGIDAGQTLVQLALWWRSRGAKPDYPERVPGKRVHITPALHAQIVELKAAGLPQREIGRRLGISEAAVSRRLNHKNSPTERVGVTEEET